MKIKMSDQEIYRTLLAVVLIFLSIQLFGRASLFSWHFIVQALMIAIAVAILKEWV